MTEVLAAIALLCQVSHSGLTYTEVEARQLKCQKEYLKCSDTGKRLSRCLREK